MVMMIMMITTMMMISNMFTGEMKNFIFPSIINIVLPQDPSNKKLFQGVQEEFADQTQHIAMILLSNHFDGGYYLLNPAKDKN